VDVQKLAVPKPSHEGAGPSLAVVAWVAAPSAGMGLAGAPWWAYFLLAVLAFAGEAWRDRLRVALESASLFGWERRTGVAAAHPWAACCGLRASHPRWPGLRPPGAGGRPYQRPADVVGRPGRRQGARPP
jgi:hypothetical protein